ncbi:hypothetical protein GCM10010446_17790 [Streptomyces enissocaesilis]|uniref:Uncharacterized protein n=1 Tax=Streptomyces enissocaesilis TaxID=332589 RepID=A0ABP6JIC7_9ACTN
MRKRVRALAVLLLPPVPGACGTEQAATPAPAELGARAGESALELIHVTGVSGYEPAEQSVGVIGNDGFSAAYFSPESGGQIQLPVGRGKLDEANRTTVPTETGTGAETAAGTESGAGEGGRVRAGRRPLVPRLGHLAHVRAGVRRACGAGRRRSGHRGPRHPAAGRREGAPGGRP